MKKHLFVFSVASIFSFSAFSQACYEVLENRKVENKLSTLVSENRGANTIYNIGVGFGAAKATLAIVPVSTLSVGAGIVSVFTVYPVLFFSPLIVSQGITAAINLDENRMQKLIRQAASYSTLQTDPQNLLVKTYKRLSGRNRVIPSELKEFSDKILAKNESGELCELKNIKTIKKLANDGGIGLNLEINDTGRAIIEKKSQKKSLNPFKKSGKVNKV